MKRTVIILIFSIFTCSAVFAKEQEYEYKPLVEQGKTWWYEAHRYNPAIKGYDQLAFGIRISETVNIDEFEWYVCRLVKPDIRNKVLDPVIAYLRQDETRVLYRPGDISGFEDKVYNEILSYAYQYNICPEHIPSEGILVCDFATEKGDAMENLGWSERVRDENGVFVYEFYFFDTQVYDVTYITNTGIQRKNMLCNDVFLWNFIDGIGETGSNYSSLFFAPLYAVPGTAISWWFMTLQGVVDVDENLLWAANESIVHPWELAGIDDLSAGTAAWCINGDEVRCTEPAMVRVLDAMAREVVAPTHIPGGGSLRLSLCGGIYMVEVTTATGRAVRKIAL